MFPVTQKHYPNIPLGKPLHAMITYTKQILNQCEVCGCVQCKSIPIIMVFTFHFTVFWHNLRDNEKKFCNFPLHFTQSPNRPNFKL